MMILYKTVLAACLLLVALRCDLAVQAQEMPQEYRRHYDRGAVSIVLDFESASRTLALLREDAGDEGMAGTLLARIAHRYNELIDPVIDRLYQFIPAGQEISAEVYVVIGGAAPAVTAGSATMIVSLSSVNDYDGLLSAFAHHFFVLVATRGREDNRRNAKGRCVTLLERACVEGTAHLLGEPFEGRIEGSFVHTFIHYYSENRVKIAQNFRIFEMMLSRLFADPSASAGELEYTYRIGFADTSLSPVHFVGYYMARVIEEEGGRGAIAELLEGGPLPFFGKYLEICTADEELSFIHFSDEIEKIITVVEGEGRE